MTEKTIGYILALIGVIGILMFIRKNGGKNRGDQCIDCKKKNNCALYISPEQLKTMYRFMRIPRVKFPEITCPMKK